MKSVVARLLIAGALVTLAGVSPAGAASLKTWDSIINKPSRFKVLTAFNSEAVLDKETGLVWQRVPSSSQVNHPNAVSACVEARTGGRGGWRLPSAGELRSLFDETQADGLPSGHPFTAPNVLYWSSTSLGVDGSCGSGVSDWIAPAPTSPGGQACDLLGVQERAWCVRAPD